MAYSSSFELCKLNYLLFYFYRPTLVAKVSESSYISKMKASGRNIVVFYGSQTGTAEEFAGRLAKEAARYGMKALVADPEECEMVFTHFSL
jgi:NADPH-ferrihemoprotein reductase